MQHTSVRMKENLLAASRIKYSIFFVIFSHKVDCNVNVAVLFHTFTSLFLTMIQFQLLLFLYCRLWLIVESASGS